MQRTACTVFSCADPAAPIPLASFAIDANGNGHFAYGRRYLARPDAFAVDPIHLPLADEAFEIRRQLDHPFGVLSDAGPNTWGLRLTASILHQQNQPLPVTLVDWFLQSWHYGSGCLGFAESSVITPHPGVSPEPVAQLTARLADVIGALSVATDTRLDPEAVRLLFPGASLGGVRPKTVVLHDGSEYIAKFSRLDDKFNVPAAEYATMRLALRAGITLPDFELIDLEGRNVLLVQRFDRAAGGRRIHYISASSLIGFIQLQQDRREYRTRYSYAGIAESIRPYSTHAVDDAQELFRRMVFNILVGNVDDHMRNHGFLRTPDGSYALSPVFDIVPHLEAIDMPQSIGVGAEGAASTMTNALSQCGRFFLTSAEAHGIIAEVREAVSHWRTEFRQAGLTQTEIYLLQSVFAAADSAEAVRIMATPGMADGNTQQ